MDATDFSALLSQDDEPTDDELRAAQVAALRRQKAAPAPGPTPMAAPQGMDPNSMEAMGLMGQLTGDRVLSPVGTSVLASAHQKQQLAQQSQERSLTRALAARKEAQQEAYQTAESADRKARLAEEARYHDGVLAQGKFAAGANGVVNTRTGELNPYTNPDGTPRAAKGEEKLWSEFNTKISKTMGKANLDSDRQKRIDAIERLEGYAFDENGNPKPLNPSGLETAATDVASVLSGGGAPTESQIKAQNPHTWKGSLASTLQFISASPQDAGGQEFLKMLRGQMKELKGTINGQILKGQLSNVPTYAHLRRSDPARFDAMLEAQGIDPKSLDERGRPSQKADAGGAPVPAAGGPDRLTTRIAELKGQGMSTPDIIATLRREGLHK